MTSRPKVVCECWERNMAIKDRPISPLVCPLGCMCRCHHKSSEVGPTRSGRAVEAERRQDQAEPCNTAPPTTPCTRGSYFCCSDTCEWPHCAPGQP